MVAPPHTRQFRRAEFFGKGRTMTGLPELHSVLTLLELIPALADHVYSMLHICHCQLTSIDEGYVTTMRQALADHNITLDMLLVDDGNFTTPNTELQLAQHNPWLVVAEELGAHRARLSLGRSKETADLLATSGSTFLRWQTPIRGFES